MEFLGGTFGKKFVKSYTIRLKTQPPPSYFMALGRFILSIIPILVMGYGSAIENPTITLVGITILLLNFAPIFFSKKRQTLYGLSINVVMIEFEEDTNVEDTNTKGSNFVVDWA